MVMQIKLIVVVVGSLDHTGKITTVAGRHVVNFQIAIEISQSFVPSRKYHSFFFFMQKIF